MSRIAYVNGRYLPFRDAKVHVEDRGYQFADAVYEVCEVRGRPPGRSAAALRKAQTLARRTAHQDADVGSGAWYRAPRAGGAKPHRLRPRLFANQPRRGA